jgi:hypothetical protein
LKVEPVDEKLRTYKPKWQLHVTRMVTEIIPDYRPNGQRQLGRPLKNMNNKRSSTSSVISLVRSFNLWLIDEIYVWCNELYCVHNEHNVHIVYTVHTARTIYTAIYMCVERSGCK